jgi:(2Fe-2S) ferredoxin
MSQNSAEAPFYTFHVFCCNNRRPDNHPRGSCAGRGSEALQAYMKGRCKEVGIENIRVNKAGCMERCELGPTMAIYPEGVWYTYNSEADVDEIIATHLQKGGRVERLMLHNDQTEPRPESKLPTKVSA